MRKLNYSAVVQSKLIKTFTVCITILLCAILLFISSVYSIHVENVKNQRAEYKNLETLKEACKAAINSVKGI